MKVLEIIGIGDGKFKKNTNIFENVEWIEAWHMIFWSSDKARCEKVFEKYKKLGGKMICI